MRRRYILLLVLALLVSGCSFGAEETQPPTEPPEIPLETRPDQRQYPGVTLTFETLWAQDTPEASILVQAADVFESRTGAEVKILWNGEGSGNADIIGMPVEKLTEHQESSMDLTLLAQEAGYDSRSHEILRQQVIDSCGSLKGIPQVPYLEGLYYNADLLEMPPENWTDFLLSCEALQSAGFLPLTMDGADALWMLELHLERSVGVSGLRDLRYGGGWAENAAAVEALEQIAELKDFGYVGTGGERKMVLSNAAMVVCGNEDCRAMEQELNLDIRWGVAPWPGTKDSGCRVTSDVLTISNTCGNPQAAFDFILLLTTGEFDQLRADLTSGIPADPANKCGITGAMETLEKASTMADTILGQSWCEMALNLWNGGYESGEELAEALDELYG